MDEKDKSLNPQSEPEEKQGQDEKKNTQKGKPDFTPEQQDWINGFVSQTKAEAKREMEDYKKQIDSTISDTVNQKLAEQERRAKMSAEEKAAEDRKELENENRKLKAKIEYNDRLSYGRSIAAQYNVPTTMVERLVGADNQETESNMKDFASAFNSAVQSEVDKRLAGNNQPQQGATVSVDSNKSLNDLSLDEQTKLFHENPDLYNQLARR